MFNPFRVLTSYALKPQASPVVTYIQALQAFSLRVNIEHKPEGLKQYNHG
jgi:hypothetical protein